MKIVTIEANDLAQAIRSGDAVRRNQAFKQLYMSARVHGKIREWVKTYNLTGKEPDDILQEGMILLDKLVCSDRFRAESKVETFLLGICKNLIRDGVKKVRRVVLKDSLPESALQSEETLADYLEMQETTEAGTRRDQALHEVLRQLTDKCQEALRLYYFEQKSMVEIAAARSLANADQAKKAVYRCREQLRDLIEGNTTLQQLFN